MFVFLFFFVALHSENVIDQWGLEEMSQNLIRDLDEYGVCVLDKFLGYEKGLQVLNEVDTMYAAGIFKVRHYTRHSFSLEKLSLFLSLKHFTFSLEKLALSFFKMSISFSHFLTLSISFFSIFLTFFKSCSLEFFQLRRY